MLGHPLRINSHGRLDASVGRVSRVLIYVGAMAEQLGRGLQNLVDRCNSGSRLVCVARVMCMGNGSCHCASSFFSKCFALQKNKRSGSVSPVADAMSSRQRLGVGSKVKSVCAHRFWASGGMAYTTDLKSVGLRPMRVRLPPRPEVVGLRYWESKGAAALYYKLLRRLGAVTTTDAAGGRPGDEHAESPKAMMTCELEGADSLLTQRYERDIFLVVG